ncbi:MOP flippase family protein [Pseudorhizobium marinum]|uniref:MOP flippase family protein n=1 Tax=Pseudorhizobium marinum TaxID=1496690 RepID=UPI0004951BF8|nr:MOP flippase family protein [Pseudorhizobium marinum]
MSVRGQAFSAVRWTATANLVRSGLAFAQIAVLARLLSPEQLGALAIVIAVTNITTMFADFGISSALVFYRDTTKHERSSIYWLGIVTASVIALSLAALSSPISEFFRAPALALPIAMMGAVIVINAAGMQLRILAERELEFARVAQIEISANFIGVVFIIYFSWASLGVYAIVFGQIIIATITSAGAWLAWAGRWRPQFHFQYKECRRFLKFGLNVLAVNVVNAIALNADIFIVGRLVSPQALAFYSQPRDICLKIMFAVNPVITRVTFPLLAQRSSDKKQVGRIYISVLRMTATVNFALYGALSLLAPELVALILGDNWSEAAHFLRWMAVWCAVRSLGNPIGSLLYALGRTDLAFKASTAVLLGILVFVGVACYVDVRAVPFALIGLFAVVSLGQWAFILRPLCEVGGREYLLAVGSPLCAITITVALTGFLVGSLSDLSRIAVAAGIGTTCYAAMSFVFNRRAVVDIMGFLSPKSSNHKEGPE